MVTAARTGDSDTRLYLLTAVRHLLDIFRLKIKHNASYPTLYSTRKMTMGDVRKKIKWLGWLVALATMGVMSSLGHTQEQPDSLEPIGSVEPVDSHEPTKSLEELQERIQEIYATTGAAALGIAVVDEGELVWLDALGHANIEQEIPATPDTLFRIGSTSKMFTALAVLKLVEEGRLDLDAPLRELIPEVEFKNRWEAEHPVRLVHLLEHTTGWHDMRIVEYAHNASASTGLEEALALYPDARESRWIPGTRHAYSNIGAGVAAYVVEKVTGMAFENYVRETLFEPLGMAEASYLQPENFIERAATAYMEQEPQEYWHILYRPAGAVNASPREMAQLLRFFLQRGQLDDQQILSPASIERMETPKTTLANEVGVTAGYGLANYTSGFKDYGVAFHGHNGGMIGAWFDFAYAPSVNGGYAVLGTGNPIAMSQVSDAVRAYLLRDQAKPALELQVLPESFRKLDGIYRPINPRQQRMNVLPSFLSAMSFNTDNQYLHRMPVAGGWDSPSNDYAISDRLLVDQWSGLPSVAIVEDPLAGEAVQVGTDLFQETSAMLVWGELLFFCSVFLLSALALVYALAWIPINLRHGSFRSTAVSIRLWPSIASLLLIAILVRILFVTMDFSVFAPWSSLSVTLFVLTLGYGAASVWSAINLFRHKNETIKRRIRLPAIALSLLHLAMTIYLASYGMIGLRIWTW